MPSIGQPERVTQEPRQFIDRESHYVWGRRYLLQRVELEAAPALEIKRGKLLLQVRPGTDEARCRDILEAWYRGQIRAVVPDLIAKWEPVMNVTVGKVYVQRMRTRWAAAIRKRG